MKYTETLPAQPTLEGAIAQFKADARAAGITKYTFVHAPSSVTTVEVKAPAWRVAKRLLRRRCALRALFDMSGSIKIQVGGKMFVIHSKQVADAEASDWEEAAEYARKLILHENATNVWIEEESPKAHKVEQATSAWVKAS